MGQTFDHVVENALARLPDRYRRVVELVDIEGLSYRGAAESLGVAVGTVMSRLHRARRRIRDQLIASGLVFGWGPAMRALRRPQPRRRPHTDSAMLTCEAAVELVQLYLDGATDEPTSEQVGHHLDICRLCGLQADVYLQIKATLAGARPVPDDAIERRRHPGGRRLGPLLRSSSRRPPQPGPALAHGGTGDRHLRLVRPAEPALSPLPPGRTAAGQWFAPAVRPTSPRAWLVAAAASALFVLGAVTLEVLAGTAANSAVPGWAHLVPATWPRPARVGWWLAVAGHTG